MGKRRGLSYQKRVADINRIYDQHIKDGVPNREIWRRFIYPEYAISERQFYNILKASPDFITFLRHHIAQIENQ